MLFQLLCLAIVHVNANRATSILLDQSLSIITIFLTGFILNRGAALVWTAITLVSLYVAVQNMGAGFEYILMTETEVAHWGQTGVRVAMRQRWPSMSGSIRMNRYLKSVDHPY